VSGAIQKSLYRALPKGRQDKTKKSKYKSGLLLLHPQRHVIGFESDEAILQKLRERLSSMTDPLTDEDVAAFQEGKVMAYAFVTVTI